MGIPGADGAGDGQKAVAAAKQAVVVIHGIGNQSPMETLRPFVEAVWTQAPEPPTPTKHLNWSQRDRKSDDLELWRITTNADSKGIRTDFFELYWADLLEDTKLADVVWWLRRLLVRPGAAVPKRRQERQTLMLAIAVMIVLVCALCGWGALALATVRSLSHSFGGALGLLIATAALGVGFWWLRRTIFIQIAGDAARYLTPAPSNIGARKRIRMAGLTLLKALHSDDTYRRIVVVGHSLGTVVGYDILSFYWADINDQIHHAANDPSLASVEKAGQAVLNAPDAARDAFRKAQRAYLDEVSGRSGGKWKITDFVTLGSPLTHAHVLLVDDRQALLPSEQHAIGASWLSRWWCGFDKAFPLDTPIASMFRARAAQRELPLCPPLTESEDRFTYAPKADKPDEVVPHHAALFAATRWTNIYAPCRNVLWGDVVGGPVAPLFGPGVKDVALPPPEGSQWLAHTHYWDEGPAAAPHLVALREALDLGDANRDPPTPRQAAPG